MRIIAPPLKSPPPSHLVELLSARALEHPRAQAFTLLVDGEEQEQGLTYGELDLRARAIAAHLQELGEGGKPVLLLYPFGLDYIAAFFGALYARAIAVPVYPPDPGRLGRTLPRLQAIARDVQATSILTTGFIHSMREALLEAAPDFAGLRWVPTDTLEPARAAHWKTPLLDADSFAFIQYTSGSTSTPRGVLLSHGNLLHNLEHVIGRSCRPEAADTWVSWLPMFHDMGLIGSLLTPLRAGGHCVLLSPSDFLQKPLRWLRAISRYQATTSGGPNFGYDLCLRKVTPEERDTLDLRHWSYAFNGAEPVRHATLERFAEYFEPCGFKRSALRPLYGLAEATLMVSGDERNAPPPSSLSLESTALEALRIEPASSQASARTLVGCGRPWPELDVVIVHPERLTRCPEQQVGEVWVAGPSVAQGYWNQPEETRRTFQAYLADSGAGPFLRTGDLGFLHHGELFITGRLKDVVIIRGRNLYPQDLEQTVEAVAPTLRPGCTAAFSVELDGQEQLVVAQEVHRGCPEEELPALARAIHRAVPQEHGVLADVVLLLRHGTIPKTSSGKIQRGACRRHWREGRLEVLLESRAPGPLEAPQPPPAPAPAEAEPAPPEEELEAVRAEISRLSGIPARDIPPGHGLLELGMDSMRLLALQQALESRYGVRLRPEELHRGTVGQLALALARAPAPEEPEPTHPLPFHVEWDLARRAPELFSRLCAQEPWVAELHARLRTELPIPPTNNLFDNGTYFRPAGHFRAFYARGPADSVLAIKGADLRCEDQAGFLQVLHQRPFERFAKYSITNVLEYFLLQERKIPGALTLPEALSEADNAAELQARFVEHFGEFGGMPVPLLVVRWSEEVVAAFCDRLLPLLNGFCLAIAQGELRQGLACYVYYFPKAPFPRVSHFAGALATESIRTGASGLQNTRLIYSTLKHNTEPERVVDSWVRLIARMLLLGYFPSNAHHFKNGQSIEPQNVLLNGTFADMDSALAMGSLQTDRDFYVNFLAMLNLLANTVRVFLTAENNGTTAQPSPFPHQFQKPDFLEILTVIHIWERLKVHIEEQLEGFQGELDRRLRELITTRLSFPVLFERILYAIYYEGPKIPESVVHMLGITDVYSEMGTEERQLERLEYDARITLDAAALATIPRSFLARLKISSGHFIKSFLKEDASVINIYETFLGRIGLIIIPMEDAEVYANRGRTLEAVARGLELAGKMGARSVSLTGLIPSATDYGRAVEALLERRPELPRITTGHATTIASFVMMVEEILTRGGRALADEHVVFLGLGSVGSGIVGLMLQQLPHPRSIKLCDLPAKMDTLLLMKEQLRRELGFQGEVTVLGISDHTPEEVYEGTLIISATSVASVLDVDKVRPGTLLVDDSAPHCFDPRAAIRRFQERRDILFTEAGAIRSHRRIEEIYDIHFATGWDHKVRSALKLLHPTEQTIMGCVFSSILTDRFEEIPRIVGIPRLEHLVANFRKLKELHFQGSHLYCEDYLLDEDLIEMFRERFGAGATRT